MNIIIGNIMQFLLIIISIVIVKSKNNIKLVIFFSLFSLITAILYYFNKAPDVALAEVAIGSAIMPLIFIISISRQQEFVVINHTEDDFLDNKDGTGYKLLMDFTNHYNLKLKIYNIELDSLKGIFRSRNVDLIVEKSQTENKYFFKGKGSTVLMNKLEQMVKNIPDINIIKVSEAETYD
ncbi:Na(+)/H(+) antiporter subunit B [Wukongibacter sp. M2B1]|uniref:Na(+)/H(+) antiporter subunit B n=1 Tax=Wukongibacter sp. M2B1 TaxID=3088895 RepID=UPI003D7BC0B2